MGCVCAGVPRYQTMWVLDGGPLTNTSAVGAPALVFLVGPPGSGFTNCSVAFRGLAVIFLT